MKSSISLNNPVSVNQLNNNNNNNPKSCSNTPAPNLFSAINKDPFKVNSEEQIKANILNLQRDENKTLQKIDQSKLSQYKDELVKNIQPDMMKILADKARNNNTTELDTKKIAILINTYKWAITIIQEKINNPKDDVYLDGKHGQFDLKFLEEVFQLPASSGRSFKERIEIICFHTDVLSLFNPVTHLSINFTAHAQRLNEFLEQQQRMLCGINVFEYKITTTVKNQEPHTAEKLSESITIIKQLVLSTMSQPHIHHLSIINAFKVAIEAVQNSINNQGECTFDLNKADNVDIDLFESLIDQYQHDLEIICKNKSDATDNPINNFIEPFSSPDSSQRILANQLMQANQSTSNNNSKISDLIIQDFKSSFFYAYYKTCPTLKINGKIVTFDQPVFDKQTMVKDINDIYQYLNELLEVGLAAQNLSNGDLKIKQMLMLAICIRVSHALVNNSSIIMSKDKDKSIMIDTVNNKISYTQDYKIQNQTMTLTHSILIDANELNNLENTNISQLIKSVTLAPFN